MTFATSTNRVNGSRPHESAESILSRHLPPSDVHLEGMVCGCAMFNLASIDGIQSILEEMFLGEITQQTLRELRAWRRDGKDFDAALFPRHMQKVYPRGEGHWDRDLAAMAGSVIHAEHITKYAADVRELWVKRQAIYQATQLIRDAHEGLDFPANLATHQTAMQRLSETGESSDPVSITTACLELMAAWESPDEAGVSSGIPQLDRLTRGLLPEAVYVIAGRPGDGKTALALTMSEIVSRERAVAIFSLEMSRLEILARLVSRLIEVPVPTIARAVKDGRPPERLADALHQLSQRQIMIDGRDHLTVDQIAATARVQANKYQLGLVVIDYLQLITPRDRRVNREQQIAESSRAIKQLAKQIRCPILLLSQMSRAIESRVGKQPQLSDLRESGAIEQDADAVLFIHQDPKGRPDERQLLVRKNRNGPLGEVTVQWIPQFTTFKPLEPQWHDVAAEFDPLRD